MKYIIFLVLFFNTLLIRCVTGMMINTGPGDIIMCDENSPMIMITNNICKRTLDTGKREHLHDTGIDSALAIVNAGMLKTDECNDYSKQYYVIASDGVCIMGASVPNPNSDFVNKLKSILPHWNFNFPQHPPNSGLFGLNKKNTKDPNISFSSIIVIIIILASTCGILFYIKRKRERDNYDVLI